MTGLVIHALAGRLNSSNFTCKRRRVRAIPKNQTATLSHGRKKKSNFVQKHFCDLFFLFAKKEAPPLNTAISLFFGLIISCSVAFGIQTDACESAFTLEAMSSSDLNLANQAFLQDLWAKLEPNLPPYSGHSVPSGHTIRRGVDFQRSLDEENSGLARPTLASLRFVNLNVMRFAFSEKRGSYPTVIYEPAQTQNGNSLSWLTFVLPLKRVVPNGIDLICEKFITILNRLKEEKGRSVGSGNLFLVDPALGLDNEGYVFRIDLLDTLVFGEPMVSLSFPLLRGNTSLEVMDLFEAILYQFYVSP
jgi:hypothetical protein